MRGVLHLRGLEIRRHVNSGESKRENGVSGGLEGKRDCEHEYCCGAWKGRRRGREEVCRMHGE